MAKTCYLHHAHRRENLFVVFYDCFCSLFVLEWEMLTHKSPMVFNIKQDWLIQLARFRKKGAWALETKDIKLPVQENEWINKNIEKKKTTTIDYTHKLC